MELPKAFNSVVVGGFIKSWNSYYDKETKTRHHYSQWIATGSVSKLSRDNCSVTAVFGCDPEETYTVARLETEDATKAELIELVARLSKTGGLPEDLKAQLVAMEQ